LSEEEEYFNIEDEPNNPPESTIDFIIDPTIYSNEEVPKESPINKSKDRRSWWGREHNGFVQKPDRRSVKKLRENMTGFCGHDKIINLAEQARINGNNKFPKTGDRDAALIIAYYLTGARKNELIKNDKKYGDVYATYGLEKSKFIYDKELRAYRVTLKILKKYKRSNPIIDSEGKKHYTTERIINYRFFPILEEEPELPILLDWMKGVNTNYLFNLGRSSVDNIIKKAGGRDWFCHRFRYERASFLRTELGYSVEDTTDYFRWAKPDEAMLYSGTTVKNLAINMRKGWIDLEKKYNTIEDESIGVREQ